MGTRADKETFLEAAKVIQIGVGDEANAVKSNTNGSWVPETRWRRADSPYEKASQEVFNRRQFGLEPASAKGSFG